MKATELMIGDWVMYRNQPRQVVYIYCRPLADGTNHANEIGFTYDEDEWVNADHVEPIPLTAEILEKNLFVRSMSVSDTEPYDLDEEGYAYYQVGNLGIDKPHLWGWFKDNKFIMPCDCTNWVTIQYVHELQHALRLCGLNELADNFKVE